MSVKLVLGVAVLLASVVSTPALASSSLSITSVSNPHPDLVSGGQVLLRVSRADVHVTRDGMDVTSAFVRQPDGTSLGLVTGLRNGRNDIAARGVGGRADLVVTNHPITGPIFSGPRQEPFFCETTSFGLAASVPPLCSAPTQVSYLYMSTNGSFVPLADPTASPADLARTTVNGRSVPYVVRLEQGTVDRAVYQIAALYDGANPQPLRTDTSWNQRLVYTFGFGCDAGYHQGAITGGVLDDLFLHQGYAVASSTLNVLNNNCSTVLSAEAAMMVKEHFIDTYGPVAHTIGWGASGGSIQQYDIADAYPGLLDGIIPGASFPNANGTILDIVSDCVLMDNYFAGHSGFTLAQQTAIAGFGFFSSCPSWDASFDSRLQPTASCDPSIPLSAQWNAVTNPNGVRCEAAEQLVNQLGVDRQTGFVNSYLDNVGIQYGLSALTSGAITPEQFVSLNESVGGLNTLGSPVAQRSTADSQALRAMYRDDLNLSATLGLETTPVIDQRDYADQVPGLNIHTASWSYVTRQRMAEAGDAANQVIIENSPAFTPSADAYDLTEMEQWLNNIESDTSHRSAHAKVAVDKPASLVDGCFVSASTTPVPQPGGLSFSGTAGPCPAAYPVYSNPRLVAGQPLDLASLKCALTPVDFASYPVVFTADQRARLRAAFPSGVCDYAKPGVQQRAPLGTWLSYGD